MTIGDCSIIPNIVKECFLIACAPEPYQLAFFQSKKLLLSKNGALGRRADDMFWSKARLLKLAKLRVIPMQRFAYRIH